MGALKLPLSSELRQHLRYYLPSLSFCSAASPANLEIAVADNVSLAALSQIISYPGVIAILASSAGDTVTDGVPTCLFMVNQHAADEKWNFETLQQKTVIASQKIFWHNVLSHECFFLIL